MYIDIKSFEYEFDEVKNQWLIENRGIGFETVINLIENDEILDIREHPNQAKYPGQLIVEVEIDSYVYIIPVLIKNPRKLVLKTVYPSRGQQRGIRRRNRND